MSEINQGVGSVYYPSIKQIVGASYSRSHGITPDVCQIEMAPQSLDPSDVDYTPIEPDGFLVFQFDAESAEVNSLGNRSTSTTQILLQGCRPDKAAVRRTANSRTWSIPIYDRRWKWKFGSFSGHWNVKKNGIIEARKERTARQLADMCLEAMGELEVRHGQSDALAAGEHRIPVRADSRRPGASNSALKFVLTRKNIYAVFLFFVDHQISGDKNALPRSDEESHLTHQNQGRAMSGKAAHIELTTRMYEILTQLTESRNASQAIIVRARIILLGFDQLKNQEIATAVDRCAKTIGIWRRRWRDSFQALLQMQFDLNQSAFRRAIIDTLSDAPRSGSPGRFTDEQLTGLIALACKDPQNSGRPVTSWTGAELADEAQRRQLVDAISASHVNRVLREVNLKPHRSRYWCNTTEQDPEKFQREVETVCQTYREAQQLADEQQTHTVCIDEMTSLQANERRAETKRARPGQPAREEFQYTRHGTVCVTANWHVTQGQLLATTITETRDNHDFARHIAFVLCICPTTVPG